MILNTLQDVAAPNVQIVAMNYYDPFVAPVWFGTQSLAALQSEVASIVAFNDFLKSIYAMFGVDVADVEAAFSLTDLTIQPSGLPSKRANVLRVDMDVLGQRHPRKQRGLRRHRSCVCRRARAVKVDALDTLFPSTYASR